MKRLLPPDSSSGARSSTRTETPCSAAAWAAQKAALPAPTTMTSLEEGNMISTHIVVAPETSWRLAQSQDWIWPGHLHAANGRVRDRTPPISPNFAGISLTEVQKRSNQDTFTMLKVGTEREAFRNRKSFFNERSGGNHLCLVWLYLIAWPWRFLALQGPRHGSPQSRPAAMACGRRCCSGPQRSGPHCRKRRLALAAGVCGFRSASSWWMTTAVMKPRRWRRGQQHLRPVVN